RHQVAAAVERERVDRRLAPLAALSPLHFEHLGAGEAEPEPGREGDQGVEDVAGDPAGFLEAIRHRSIVPPPPGVGCGAGVAGFGSDLGHGPKPYFWVMVRGRRSRASTSPSPPPTVRPSTPSTPPRSPPGAATTALRARARSTTPATTAPS